MRQLFAQQDELINTFAQTRVTLHVAPLLPVIVAVTSIGTYDILKPTLRKLNYQTIDPGALPSSCASKRPPSPALVVVDAALAQAEEMCARFGEDIKTIIVAHRGVMDARLRFASSKALAVVAIPDAAEELREWIESAMLTSNVSAPTILFVDDDQLFSQKLGAELRLRGYKIHLAANARELLEAMNHLQFDLILMDIHLPDLSGFELTRMVRQDRRHIAAPIVFLSGDVDAGARMRAIRDGGDDCFAKQMDLDVMTELLARRVDRARTLRSLIERDSLTGLLNHLKFQRRLDYEVLRSQRRKSNLSLVMFDIDHFKRINDSYGHQVGDFVIASLSRMLVSWFRQTDIVARYGGEEFAVAMPDATEDDAARVADEFRLHVARHAFHAEMQSLNVTISAGVGGGSPSRSASALIGAADAALYDAKRRGRNRTCRAATSQPAGNADTASVSPNAYAVAGGGQS